jgi:hypothetical protein
MTQLRRYWLLLAPLILVLPQLDQFPFPGSGAQFSDLALTHYPNALFLQRALANGSIPLWSPQILGGFPFIAHPYSGIWYPPYWLALLFPLPLGLKIVLALHILWAGIGAYKLVRQAGAGHEASLVAGLAFAAAPKFFAHLGAGHLMLLLAVSWTPWLLWSSRGQRRWMPAAILAVIFAADPRWAIYAGIVWLAWELSSGASWRRAVSEIALAAGLAAPAVLLYSQYALLSTRALLTAKEVMDLSLPPATLLGLLIPQLAAFHEWVIYPGIVVLLLAIIAKPWADNGRRDRFWIVVLLISIVVALGAAVPGMRQLAGLPGFSQLRIPPRALFLASLAFAWLAAFGLQALLEVRLPARTARLASVGAFAAAAGLFLVSLIATRTFWNAAGLAAVFALVFLILLQLRITKRIPVNAFAYALPALIAVDLLIVDASLVHYEPAQQVLGEDQEVVQFIVEDQSVFRVYSPSYSLAQQTAAYYGIQLANGVDPLQLASYADFMTKASGVPAAGYSVALPPIAGELAIANAAYSSDAELLGLLNVKYVFSEFPLSAAGLEEASRVGSSFVYLNDFVMPRAWVENAGEVKDVEDFSANYNEIAINAEGPGRLVLSEIYYPGWQATIDGQRVEIEPYRDVLRSLTLPAGQHAVNFYFRPPLLYAGLLIAASTLVYIAKTKEQP